MTTPTFPTLMVAPAQVRRGAGVLATVGEVIARLGQRPLLVGGERTLASAAPFLKPALRDSLSAQPVMAMTAAKLLSASSKRQLRLTLLMS